VLRSCLGSRVARILEYRHLPVILGILAAIATLPALGTGLLNDDFCHWALMAGPADVGDRLRAVGLSSEDSGRLSTALSEQFGPVDPQGNLALLKKYGAMPWWTYDGLRVRLWRPLSSLTHWLDYRLLGGSTVWMHAHNLVWLAGAVFLVGVLHRRLTVPASVAALAALMYVLDDFSYFPAMWIANRNIFISLVFGLLCLLWHDRWRRAGQIWAGAASVVCLAGALFSAEAGVATCAYLFAYAVVLDKGGKLQRSLSLAPAAVVSVGWRIVYNLSGHGASGGSFYLDPSREPLQYARAIVLRGPILVLRQWSGIPADIYSYISDSARLVLWLAAAILAAGVLVLLLPLLRANRVARFWAVGMHLSVLPVCATMPMNRNLLFAGIGAYGVIALFVAGFVAGEGWIPRAAGRRALTRVLCIIFVLAHVPCALVSRVAAPVTTSKIVEELKETMDAEPPDDLAGRELVVVNAPNPASFFYIPFQRAYEGRALPRAIRVLAPAFGPIEIVRQDDKTLTLKALAGNLLSCRPSRGFNLHISYLFEALSAVQGRAEGLRLGQVVNLPGMSVEILEVDAQSMPMAVRFRFAVSLDHDSLVWLWWSWKKDRYLPFEVPAVGERLTIRGPF